MFLNFQCEIVLICGSTFWCTAYAKLNYMKMLRAMLASNKIDFSTFC
jgi:hypothetical protein